ncbi:MAG: hypothetical protein A2406_01865 [Candidatus Komeilibacteria bacterium RIFOXYC1_FULL_37_11]|uniref:Uncharacterized protein n=1 Tax=Candidatus Komeilibacteria bacterium RIFOXYC1_FULL_37_11 TaxID=1798555 RepID=A0A1G2BYH9_9BACT|nr:MAG: hypothetical protein A2406_01865 [Candidatus Komeilibacteria bacterium RIFOXYC1_FULL_37_11]OGY95368.1 MAG: hypothetical protein A2611_01570 [Candidatus Komeilibacteria bacterium RIFOXYD1_FULL_37_29]OGY96035.1 MAG: hypothetical protein A2543_00015 [Candidatus Komeilibacteria bacterium RIFOXYD2_FULL_37_8]
MLILAFAGLGLVAVFFTHEAAKPSELVSMENYVIHVEPWISQAHRDQSLANITVVRDNFLNFKGSDHSMGATHLALFLAFDAWQRFLITGDNNNINQSLKHFSVAKDLLPELRVEIENLENLLRQKNA